VRRHTLLFLLVGVLAFPVSRAAQLTLTPAEIEEAVRLGQTRIAADRTRFHAPYRIVITQPPVDYIEVVTPFRRVVLAADERARFGDRSFGQRQAMELVSAAHGRFDLDVELTFHPLNTFVAMPAYDVALVRAATRVTPAALDRVPRFGARVDDLPSSLPVTGGRVATAQSQPLLGGTLVAQFEGDAIDGRGTMDVVVTDGAKELARATIDFSRLR